MPGPMHDASMPNFEAACLRTWPILLKSPLAFEAMWLTGAAQRPLPPRAAAASQRHRKYIHQLHCQPQALLVAYIAALDQRLLSARRQLCTASLKYCIHSLLLWTSAAASTACRKYMHLSSPQRGCSLRSSALPTRPTWIVRSAESSDCSARDPPSRVADIGRRAGTNPQYMALLDPCLLPQCTMANTSSQPSSSSTRLTAISNP